MNAIYKYPVPIDDDFTVVMPIGARLLSVQMQRGTPCLWAVVDLERKKEPKRFMWIGTGHEHSADDFNRLRPVGTVQLEDGALVFHLFEVCA